MTLEVRHCPGHGPLSSIGEERESNPFVSDRAPAGAQQGSGGPRFL